MPPEAVDTENLTAEPVKAEGILQANDLGAPQVHLGRCRIPGSEDSRRLHAGVGVGDGVGDGGWRISSASRVSSFIVRPFSCGGPCKPHREGHGRDVKLEFDHRLQEDGKHGHGGYEVARQVVHATVSAVPAMNIIAAGMPISMAICSRSLCECQPSVYCSVLTCS